MSTSITLGKARIIPFTVSLSNGGTDTTTNPSSVATNQSSNLKVVLNPNNNREVGVIALAPTTGADVNVFVAAFIATVTLSVPTPTITGAQFGTPGGELDQANWPSWLTL